MVMRFFMNKAKILKIFSEIDRHLQSPASLCLYGSGAFMLLDEDDRTSLDLDIAAPYSDVDFADFSYAVECAGLAINPSDNLDDEHIEWISMVRLCLADPATTESMVLWQGSKLQLFTVSPPDLVASKLIRYDDIDKSDIHYLVFQMNISFKSVCDAVARLPEQFRDDVLVKDNLLNFEQDIRLWKLHQ